MRTANNLEQGNASLLRRFAKKSEKIDFINGDLTIIYTRVSSKGQAEKNMSLPTQKKYCEEYCMRNNFKIMAFFGGTHESAKTDERKEFKAMLDFIKKSKAKISNIVIFSFDRFSRAGSIYLVDQLRKRGIRILSVLQPVDSNTASGRFQQKIHFVFSEYDNEQRREKCITGMKEKLLRGEWINKPPVGYEKVLMDGKIQIVVNEKGKLLKKAFQWKLQENILSTEILTRLSNRGLKLSKQRLSDIFRNLFYCGYISGTLLDGKIVEGKHEKLISPEQFLKLNGILDDMNYKVKHQAENAQLPLKIFIKCADCGSSLTGYEVKKKKLFYYKCNKKGCCCNKSAKYMHSLFSSKLKSFSVDPAAIEFLKIQLNSAYQQLTADNKGNKKQLKSNLTELTKKQDTLAERWALGEISKAVYEKFAPQYLADKLKIEQELSTFSLDRSNLERYLHKALEISSNLMKAWELGTYTQKQRLQYLIFPEGMVYNRKNDQVQTNRVNSVFCKDEVLLFQE